MGATACQQVCPRNEAYTNQAMPPEASLEARAGDFHLEKLLAMTDDYYAEKIWPLCFLYSQRQQGQMADECRPSHGKPERPGLCLRAGGPPFGKIPMKRCEACAPGPWGGLGERRPKRPLSRNRVRETGLARREIRCGPGDDVRDRNMMTPGKGTASIAPEGNAVYLSTPINAIVEGLSVDKTTIFDVKAHGGFRPGNLQLPGRRDDPP